ncbi:hypothetical protein ACI2OX_19210 [Bacillus sp. N9]
MVDIDASHFEAMDQATPRKIGLKRNRKSGEVDKYISFHILIIKTKQEAINLIQAGASRIGTSRILV